MSGGVTISPLAGQPAPEAMLVDLARLERAYYEHRPDPSDATQLVRFGTSGHRGSPLHGSFTEAHILAVTQAICEYRRRQGVDGPLYMGKDTHGVSGPAQRTALEVLAANGVDTVIQRDDGVTPTPVISRAILAYNRGRTTHLADGIVVTPSHNPPEDGGFKYNPPHGGPADTEATQWIQDRANDLLRTGIAGVKRVPFAAAIKAATTHQEDLLLPYVQDLGNVVDMDVIRGAGLRLGVDPLGGAARPYWEPINAVYGLDIAVVNPIIDPTFSFMTVTRGRSPRAPSATGMPWVRSSTGLPVGSERAGPSPGGCDQRAQDPRRHEGQAPRQHRRGEGAESHGDRDAEVHENGGRQDDRPPEPVPHQEHEAQLVGQREDVPDQADPLPEPVAGRDPSHVRRRQLVGHEGEIHGGAVPPGAPLELRRPRAHVDDAHDAIPCLCRGRTAVVRPLRVGRAGGTLALSR
jgi:hypothetical protein